MKCRIGVLYGDDKDYYVYEIYPETEHEIRSLTKLISELKRRGIEVKKCFSVEYQMHGWVIYIDLNAKVFESLKLP